MNTFALEPLRRSSTLSVRRSWAIGAVVMLAHAGLLWLLNTPLHSRPSDPTEADHVIMANVVIDAQSMPTLAPAPPSPQREAAPKVQASPMTPITAQQNPMLTQAAPSSVAPSVTHSTARAVPAEAPAAATASAAATAIVLPVSDADYLNNPPPTYPRMSRRMGEQGTVILRVFISAEGRAEQAEIRSSSGHKRLDEAALETVRGWRYVPGKRAGVAEAMWFNVPIRFVLD